MSEYALSVLVPLPTGEKKYELLSRETVEERAASLVSLETMEDLLASLEEDQEISLRSLLAESATGEEESLEVMVGEANYPVLASVIEYLVESAEQSVETTVPLEEAVLVEGETVMCDGISTKETMSHVREGLKSIEAIYAILKDKPSTETPESVEGLRSSLIQNISLSERVLGLEASMFLKDKTTLELQALSSHLYPKAAILSPGTPKASIEESIDTETPVSTETIDTSPSDIIVDNPLLGEEHTEVPSINTVAPTLGSIRKSLGGLITPEFRKELLKGARS